MTKLLQDIERYCGSTSLEVILTLNVPETLLFLPSEFAFPLRVIRNEFPQGFGENHNAAFRQSNGCYFCVMNPDIRLSNNPFPVLLAQLKAQRVGLVAPQVLNPEGQREDSARKFPSPGEIIKKFFGGSSAVYGEVLAEVQQPDWVAGMFFISPRQVYAEIGGFDERYFLYYEDVDFCARLKLAGYHIRLCSFAIVIHDARRRSHRSLVYLRWHFSSMLRFFLSDIYRKIRQVKR